MPAPISRRRHELVLTADALVEGRHYLASDPADLIARKMLRVNLSDLAAKGARAVGYLMTTALGPDIDEVWIEKFVKGLAEDQKAFGVSLMGGDTVATPGPTTLSVTAIGIVPQGKTLRRNGAKVGDKLFVSGTIGDGALGLQGAARHTARSPTRRSARRWPIAITSRNRG